MSKKPDSQKGSGAKKHRRNYRAGLVGRFPTYSSLSRYRLYHAIPAGTRKQNHREGRCPLHRKNSFGESPN